MFLPELRDLKENRNYLFITASMTLLFASYIALITNQDLLYKPFGFTSKEVGIFNIILVISGIIGSMICARFLDSEQPRYKLMYNICAVSGLIFVSLFLVTLPSGVSKILFGVNVFLYGLFMIPTFSIIFPYVVELTYPSNESVSNGLMLFSCRIFATTFVSPLLT
jgi:hypothetical protein